MFKKINLILGTIFLVAIILTTITYANVDKWYSLGQKVALLKNDPNREVIARINGKEITKNDLEIGLLIEQQKYEYQTKKYESITQQAGENVLIPPPQKASPDELLDRFIDNEVLYQEAKSQGLEVSYEEAKKYAEEVRKSINDACAGKIEVADRQEFMEIQNYIKQYIKGLGLSEDEYWNKLIPGYQKFLSIGKLKEKILSSMPEEERRDPAKVHSYFEQYKNNLRKKYNIEILQKSF
ncbi:SurA N-terminal domain-containing protein [Caldanaerovirga acetigignens]|uniref:SurA N-terminal domain-containing protein n=1 Tax=Caldanaerovirga acetigignens TaxID=447595 RepID=A0A1M7MN26_9FIRM|nr:SurA N-terminal domain-containing protein [Caldanaerovirga acetigignens]SHM91899.1 SurA N-terminal domain-containing protein [Caldanaerovirga acetigignens]